jgi:transporter family-2 protein
MNAGLLVLIAVVAGVAVALQGNLMGAMDRAAGTVTSVFVTYGVGGLVATALWLGRRESLAATRTIPWYSWSAGLLGLIIVAGIGFAAPRLGLSRTLVITIAAQLVTALLLDRSFDPTRIAGCALTIVGAWLAIRP